MHPPSLIFVHQKCAHAHTRLYTQAKVPELLKLQSKVEDEWDRLRRTQSRYESRVEAERDDAEYEVRGDAYVSLIC